MLGLVRLYHMLSRELSISRIHSLIMLPKVVWFTQAKVLLRRATPSDERMSIDERRKYLKLAVPGLHEMGNCQFKPLRRRSMLRSSSSLDQAIDRLWGDPREARVVIQTQ